MAPVGNNQLNSWQFMAEKFNANNPAGVKFEIVGFDNKLAPTESLNALKSAIDQGIRYIIQGNGSSVALALIDAVNKHNERNPGKEVVYLNYAAVDPDLTNSKCSFWHFRFDADTTMKMEAMTTFMKDQKDINKVYLLNQNYSHGQQVAKYAKEYLKQQAPRHRDRRRRPAPARAGARLRALHRQDQGLGRRHGDHRQLGLRPGAAGQGGERGRLQRQVLHLLRRRHRHADGARQQRRRQGLPGRRTPLPTWAGTYDQWGRRVQGRSSTTTSTPARSTGMLELLGHGDGPGQVDRSGEGRRGDGRPEVQERFSGEVEMRKTDHQLQQPLYITVWQKADAQVRVQRREHRHDASRRSPSTRTYVSSTPTSCQMKRPGA